MSTKIRLGFGVVITAVLLLGVVSQIGQGAMLRVSPPPQDAANVGMTPAEVQSLRSRESNIPPSLTSQQLAARESEIAAHTRLKEQVLRPVKDVSGSIVWQASTVTAIQEILIGVTGDSRKVGRIVFPETSSIRISLESFEGQSTRRDLIGAARVVLEKLPDVENIEFWVYGKNGDTLALTGEEGIVRTSRSRAMSILSEAQPTSNSEVTTVLKDYFDLTDIGEWVLR